MIAESSVKLKMEIKGLERVCEKRSFRYNGEFILFHRLVRGEKKLIGDYKGNLLQAGSMAKVLYS